ncbi:hypothetical protein ABK040_005472 [Willaertia magna]
MDNFDQFPPELLNERNKALSLQVKEKEREQKEKEKALEVDEERKKVLAEHLRSAAVEIQNTQLLIEAKNNEIETENHLKQVAERELGRLKNEVQRIDKKSNELQDKTNIVQNELFRANEKLEQIRTNLGFNQEELEQWTLAERQKDDDHLALEKYSKKDEKKIKDLMLENERWARAVEEKRAELQREITETQSIQIELEKTAEDYKTKHIERQDVVNKWESTIQSMNKRDEMIQKAGERFAEGKNNLQLKQEELFEQTKHYEQHVQNNRELNQKIEKSTRIVESLRDIYEKDKKHLSELEDELDVIKNTLAKASSDLNNKRIEKRGLEEELKKKQTKLELLEKQKQENEQQLEDSGKYLNDLESRAKFFTETLAGEEVKLKNMNKRIEELKSQHYHESQELFKTRQRESNLVAEIGGTNAQNKNMVAKINQLETVVMKQQELLYNIEFQIQQMERKVHRASGERTEEEKERLNNQIAELQAILDNHEVQFNMLKTEWNKVLSEARKMKKETDKKEGEKGKLEEKVHDLALENNSLEDEFKLLTKEKEELLVQHDIQKLQVKRLRDLLRSRTDELTGLENRKFQLEMAYVEKEQQVKAHKELLIAELKAYEEERRKLNLELNNRKVYIDKLKNKYNILIQRMKPDEEDGEVVSQAQFLIRAIQEREELQRIGDKLDEEIQKLENQDRGLEITMNCLKNHNRVHMGHYKKVDENDPNMKSKSDLERKIKDLDSLMSRRMQEQANYEESANLKKRELEMAIVEKKEIDIQKDALFNSKTLLDKDVSKLRAALNTQKTLLKNQLKEIKKTGSLDENQLRDIQLTEMKLKNRYNLLTLSAATEGNVEMKATLDRLLAEEKLTMPNRPSSSSASVRSSSRNSGSARSTDGIPLVLNNSTLGQLNANQVAYYSIDNVPDLGSNSTLSFIVTALGGDTDIYISTTQYPNIDDPNTYQWKSTIQDVVDRVTLTKSSTGYKPSGPYYLTVHSYNKPSIYTINVIHSDQVVISNPGTPQSAFIAENQSIEFKYECNVVGFFTISVRSLFGDTDMYVSTTEHPTKDNSQWKSDQPGDETLRIQNANIGTVYYIGLFGRQGVSSQFHIQISDTSTHNIIADGTTIDGFLQSRKYIYYKYYLVEKADLSFTVNRKSFVGDPDIWISRTNPYPSQEDHEKGETGYLAGTITLEAEETSVGWYYITVYDDSFFDVDYTLTVNDQQSVTTLSVGLPLTKTIKEGKYDYYLLYSNEADEDVSLDISATSTTGQDVTIYVSKTQRYPSEDQSEFQGEVFGNQVLVHFDTLQQGPLYIAIKASENTNYTITAITSHNYILLEPGEQYTYSVRANGYKRFAFIVDEDDLDIVIGVTSSNGDADVYASITEPISESTADWKSELGRSDVIHIKPNDYHLHLPQYKHRIYVAVKGFTSSTFTIIVHSTDDIVEIENGISISGEIEEADEGNYYKFQQTNNAPLTFNLLTFTGDSPSLYISTIDAKPGPNSYQYKSEDMSTQFYSINYARSGYYFIGVYGSENTTYILTVSSGRTQLNTYGLALVDRVLKGQYKYYYSAIYPSEHNVVVGLTLIEGNTELYINNSTLSPDSGSHDYADRSWPGNYISVPVNPSLPDGTWVYSVYGVEESTYYIHASYNFFEGELVLGQPKISQVNANDQKPATFVYNRNLKTNSNYYIYINSISTTETFIGAYVDQYPNQAPNATNSKWGASGNDDLVITIKGEELEADKEIYICVYSHQGVARFHVVFEEEGKPLYLTEEAPNKIHGSSDKADLFKVFSLKNAQGLKVVVESCMDTAPPVFYVSNHIQQPDAEHNDHKSAASGTFRQLVELNSPETDDFYYIATGKSDPSVPTLYTIYATTGTDRRPIPPSTQLTVGPFITTESKRIFVPRITTDNNIRYYVYKRILSSKEDPNNVNMQTVCGVRNGEADLVGEISIPPDYPETLTIDVPVKDNQKYIINVLAINGYGLSSVYQPLTFGVDNSNYLTEGESIIDITNGTECKQFVFSSTTPLPSGEAMHFVVTPFSGDVDLYVSNVPTASKGNFVFMSESHGFDLIKFDRSDPKYFAGPYYVGVCSTGSDITEFSIMAYKSSSRIKLKDGQTQLVYTPELAYNYFDYYLDSHNDFRVQLSPVYGDPDGYVSVSTQTPTSFNHEWRSDLSIVDVVKISALDENYKSNSNYYIGVQGFRESLYSISVSKNDTLVHVLNGVASGGSVEPGEYQYFKFKLTHNSDVTITVNPVNPRGDPDIYVSVNDNNQYPTEFDHDFQQSSKSDDTLVIKTTDEGWRVGWYYIAIKGYNQPTVFELTVISTDSADHVLQDGIVTSLTASTNSWTFFAFYYGFEANQLIFSAKKVTGKLEMYCSQGNSRPGKDKYDYLGEENGVELTATIPQNSKVGWYYCGVYSYSNSYFQMTAYTNQHPRQLIDGVLSTNNYVKADHYIYFIYDLQSLENVTDVTTMLYMDYGDADIYCSTNTSHPTIDDYIWKSDSAFREHLVIPKSEIYSGAKSIFCGVHGFSSTSFDIIIYGKDSVVELLDSTPFIGAVEPNTHQRFSFKLETTGEIQIVADVLTGWPANVNVFVDVTPYPTKEHHIWESTNFGKDVLHIEDAQPNTYYISIYGSPMLSTKFSVVVSTLYSNVLDGSQVLDYSRADAYRYYRITVPVDAESIMITDTLINGKTELYVNTNSSFPTKESHVFSSSGLHINGLLITKADNPNTFVPGVWTVGVYSVTPSSYYFSVQTKQGSLANGVPRVGLITDSTPATYIIPIEAVNSAMLELRLFGGHSYAGCAQVTAYQTANNTYLDGTDSNGGLMLKIDQLQYGLPLTIKVETCKSPKRFTASEKIVRYSITFTPHKEPVYLLQDYYTTYSMLTENLILLSPRNAEGLNVELDSCDDSQIGNTGKLLAAANRDPSDNPDFVSSKVNNWATAINTKSVLTTVNYNFKISAQHIPVRYSIFASTRAYDPRPNPVDYNVKTIFESYDLNVPSKYHVTVSQVDPKHRFYVYALALDDEVDKMSDSDVLSIVNFHTLCAVRGKNSVLHLGTGDVSNTSFVVSLYPNKDYIINIVNMDETNYLSVVSKPQIVRSGSMKSGDTILGVGGILLLLVLGAVIVYLVVGILIKVIKYKARGIEMIPNIDFWKLVIALFLDGVQFVFFCEMFRGIRDRRRTGYGNIEEEDTVIPEDEGTINNPEAYQQGGEEDVEDINPFSGTTPPKGSGGYSTIV